MTSLMRKQFPSPLDRDNEAEKPVRLLDIFRQLQDGEITEEDAVKALEARRKRRYGRVGRIVEALTS